MQSFGLFVLHQDQDVGSSTNQSTIGVIKLQPTLGKKDASVWVSLLNTVAMNNGSRGSKSSTLIQASFLANFILLCHNELSQMWWKVRRGVGSTDAACEKRRERSDENLRK